MREWYAQLLFLFHEGIMSEIHLTIIFQGDLVTVNGTTVPYVYDHSIGMPFINFFYSLCDLICFYNFFRNWLINFFIHRSFLPFFLHRNDRIEFFMGGKEVLQFILVVKNYSSARAYCFIGFCA